jgi:hypothetical protein
MEDGERPRGLILVEVALLPEPQARWTEEQPASDGSETR